ncbi:hypothetical protein Q8W40_11895 [Vibrio penaeicida]|uniref:hypothetical protein n=1 Tax=Vibrio penaeicida TaxID=104609 RepID=UPI002732B407|nr:hypothetical protein [Vibrio penaeicida]MDP2572887.1 hypothetical protein [Vibrio penaeicida]
MKNNYSTNEFLRATRSKKLDKENSKKKRKKRSKNVPYSSTNMRNLSYMSERHSSIVTSKTCVRHCPKLFSLIEHPETTLEFISDIAQLGRSSSLRKIHLDHSSITCHDLGAEVLLGIAVKAVKSTAMTRNRKVLVRGSLPKSERKQRLIRSMGVIKQLDIEHENFVEDKLELFDFVGQKSSTVKYQDQDRKNQCTTKFVDHLNNCLSYSDKQLTEESIGQLVNYLGEIIGNAEDHSGENKWYVCGYLDHVDENKESDDDDDNYHFCEIVIYNFGKSIAETFMELSHDSFTMKQVKPYIDAHEKSNFFSKTWDRSTLLTLIALQGYVSSKNQNEDTDRGQGTVDLIEFFQSVSEERLPNSSKKARMAIISGDTHIYFDGTHRIKVDDTGKDVIAFNSSNDLSDKPDHKYVRKMKNVSFPGTIIAARFPISKRYTETA